MSGPSDHPLTHRHEKDGGQWEGLEDDWWVVRTSPRRYREIGFDLGL